MAVTPKGLVEWRVPAEFRADAAEVILTVRLAAGREIFHTFTVRLPDE